MASCIVQIGNFATGDFCPRVKRPKTLASNCFDSVSANAVTFSGIIERINENGLSGPAPYFRGGG